MPASYATWNPLDKNAAVTLSDGDLTASIGAITLGGVRATLSKTANKWYWEITATTVQAATGTSVGVGTSSANLSEIIGYDSYGWGWQSNGWYRHSNSAVYAGVSFVSGDIVQIALDLDNGKLWFGKNGTWNASGNPSAGANPIYTGVSGTIFPICFEQNLTSMTANFGASAFSYAVPEGFNAGWLIPVVPVEDSLAEDVTVADDFAANQYAARSISEDVSVQAAFSDNIGELSEDVAVLAEFFDNMGELVEEVYVSVAFDTAGSTFNADMYEEISVHSPLVGTQYIATSITDALDMGDTSDEALWYYLTNMDTLDLTDDGSAARILVSIITDLLFLYDTQITGWGVTNTESLELTDTQAISLGIAISDWLTLIDSQTNNWNGRDIITDTLNLYDLCQGAKIFSNTINESLVVTDTNLFGLTVTILEHLGFADLASAMKSCAESLADGFVLADSTDRGFNFTITEALSAVDVLSVVTTFLGTITEALGLTDTLTGIKRAYPSISESLVLSESITSSGMFYNTITETLRMSVLVELSGEVYECYVLNTPKFMPSMYSGFNFNSYCVFENRAFGANDTGIYELTGSTDAGATIHTGAVLSKTDFGAPNQKRFRRGYLGITGSNPVMVFEAEDGKREAYNIDTQGKVVASSELKSKSWKLSVADFDELDTIKLIPIILTK